MDRAKLAMKWQTPERLIDLIVNQTAIRSRKGEAFLCCRSDGDIGRSGNFGPSYLLPRQSGRGSRITIAVSVERSVAYASRWAV